MRVRLSSDATALAKAAADDAAELIRAAIARRGTARVVAATGTSQLAFLDALTAAPALDWTKVQLFHLDEYVGLSIDHPASFRGYLLQRLIRKTGIARYHLLDGDGDLDRVLADANRAVSASPIDVAFAGIGENGHLAFNDPPANFTTEQPYLIVTLDEACRRQQVGEGWFPDVAAVPRQAITMSVRQLLSAQALVCVVPDARKAAAVKAALTGPVTPEVPASILRTHANATLYLDAASASLLDANAPDLPR